MTQRAWLLCTCVQLLLVGAVLVVFPGCGDRPFSIVETRVCKTVDAAGKPGPQATTFAAEDKMAYIWFEYTGAKPGQKIKVKFTHTDEAGNRSEEEIGAELKEGGSVAVAQMAPQEGDSLTPGAYECQITNESDIGYGAPMAFTVE